MLTCSDHVLRPKEPRKPVTEVVPFFGDEVTVKAISSAERDQWEWDNVQQRGANRDKPLRNVRARLCVLAIVDPSNMVRVFKDQDAEALGHMDGSAADLDAVYEVAARLAGISKQEREAIEKNSESGPGAASRSV